MSSASSSSSSSNSSSKQPRKTKNITVSRGGEVLFHLGQEKAISVNNFKGKTLVHIRKFFQAGNGQLYPTKTGITLSLDEFGRLRRHLGEIDQQIEKMERKQQEQKQQQQQQHQRQQRQSQHQESEAGPSSGTKRDATEPPQAAKKKPKLTFKLSEINSQLPTDYEDVEIEDDGPPLTQWQPMGDTLCGMYKF